MPSYSGCPGFLQNFLNSGPAGELIEIMPEWSDSSECIVCWICRFSGGPENLIGMIQRKVIRPILAATDDPKSYDVASPYQNWSEEEVQIKAHGPFDAFTRHSKYSGSPNSVLPLPKFAHWSYRVFLTFLFLRRRRDGHKALFACVDSRLPSFPCSYSSVVSFSLTSLCSTAGPSGRRSTPGSTPLPSRAWLTIGPGARLHPDQTGVNKVPDVDAADLTLTRPA
ncbi:hypothetical protein K438DRAFT_1782546 [Mycena galopus ATCC 62051]|nr:hypothetical protein K438DRAFT_1782546 [Mycena galopus ATCC 62051]